MKTLHGAGLGYKRSMADDFLNLNLETSAIQFIEIAPENWLRMGGAARKKFDAVAERFPIACHGLSLSLGGQDPLQIDFLRQVKAFLQQYDIEFFSEHLSYCSHHGHVYDLLPLPFTEESVHHTAARIRLVQDILEQRIAIENTSYYAHSPIAEMDEVDFLNAVVREADCNIHLDVNNVYVNAVNHGIVQPNDYINRTDLNRVCYMHMAGHDEESENLLIDTHGQPVCADVWDLFAYTCHKLPHNVPTLLERDSNFPPFAELEAEVSRIAAIQQQAEEARHAAA
ncbi:Protein of uncharacterised function (DUF692) [Neisseria animaloris]|uniref:UPF0276 protein NCTC12227_01750 n=1 Tax=Neisseria animaloris TaxID=326522 RepID=A0A1X3CHP2_9NEIS|nr:DUF692 domain-containing protein [Neisseria animaloris]MDO5073622.1 DUF692 domain-containing protein [Neisseria animaloris]OSI07096.1 hypothetical protein BWD08_08810 [Neisseria animaloris]VEH87971.1 Protein of uncharacterised function (DUF692) [Neisseria animaloris]VEJ21983.1 Protein of uncharacterised function (DUF692) [Neisseria animaloris]